MYYFPYLEPVCSFMSSSNCCFLTSIQISQEAGQVVWYSHLYKTFQASAIAQLVKKPSALQETLVQFLDWEDPLEKGKATHSSILAW